MKKHISTLHEKSKNIGIFKCPICENKAFKTKEFLEKHIERRHTQKEIEEEKSNQVLNEPENNPPPEMTISRPPEMTKSQPPETMPMAIDEDKIISNISDKLTTELGRIQFNLQLEFNEKLKQLEVQSKENVEFFKSTLIPPPHLSEVSGLDKSDAALNEVLRLNENLIKSQYNQMNFERTREEMKSSLTQTQKTLGDYSQKLKKLNKNMKKITKENKNFQKSFFHSLKEYQNEIKTMESQRDVVREDVEDSSNKHRKKVL